MPPRSNTSPQAQIDLRAQMEECPPVFLKVLGAFNIKGWKNGKKKLTVKEIWAYSGVPVETLRDALKAMCDRDWLKRERRAGGTYTYEKMIEEMTWDEAHELARHRLTGEAQQQTLFDKKNDPVPRGTSQGVRPNQPRGLVNLATPPLLDDPPDQPEGVANLATGSGQIGHPIDIRSSLSSSFKVIDHASPDGDGGFVEPTKRTKKAKDPFRAHDGSGWKDLQAAFEAAWKAARRQIGAAGEGSDQERADLNAHMKKGGRGLSALAKGAGFTIGTFRARLANLHRHTFAARQDFGLAYFCSHYSEFDDGQIEINAQRERGGGAYHGARSDWDDDTKL